MSKVYDKLTKLVANKEEMIEQFVRFYGEEYREKITNRIKEMDIVFIAADLPKFTIRDLMMQKYKNNPEVDVEKRVENLFTNLDNLSNNSDLVVPQVLLQEKDVLTKLGFNIDKIIPKGSFEIINNEETQRLKNFIKADKKEKDIKDLPFDIESVRKYYNSLASATNLEKREELEKEHMSEINGSIEFVSSYLETAETNANFVQMKKNLSEQEELFLQDFLSTKGPASLWKDEFSNYVVKNLNSIFNKNFQTIQDVTNDESMKTFMHIQDRASKYKEKRLKIYNNKNYKNTKIFKNQDQRINDQFLDDLDAMAAYKPEDDFIAIPLDKNTTYSVIMHEVNHALSRWKTSKEIVVEGEKKESNPITIAQIGFNCKSEVDKEEKIDTTPFNEIVNEYLTQEVMKTIPEEELESKPIFKNQQCDYSSGVNLMKEFLDKYKKVLIKSQLDRGDMVSVTRFTKEGKSEEVSNDKNPLMSFIGEFNYKYLMLFTQMLGNFNYGKFLLNKQDNKGKEILEISDWLESYKADPKQALEKIDSKIERVWTIISFEQFLKDLINNYNKFENNEIKQIKVKSLKDIQQQINESKTIDDSGQLQDQ